MMTFVDLFLFVNASLLISVLRLVGLCGTLQSNLESHMNIIQASQRNFRQTLESKLDGLRETNVQLIKSFK